MNANIAYLPVRCISAHEVSPDQICVGHEYIIDRLSIWIDCDGDAYGVVYDTNMNRIGQMKLSHFSGV